MCFFITLAMWLFWRMDQGERKPALPWCFALAVFGAIFSKGPVGFLFPLLGCLVWLLAERRLRDFGRAWGWRTWLVLVVLCGIWWGSVYLEGGRDYIHNLLVHQTVDRAVDAFHHKRPVYWYLYVIWYAMGPWSLLTIPVSIWGAVRHKLQGLSRFFLLVSAAFFILMSLFSGKLQIYLLPLFGFVNYACFMILAESEKEMPGGGRILRRTCDIVAGVLLAGVLVAGLFFPDIF
jgi:4-amino-4-deoxy-L-arabinose transferase-like glycosyltransferase